MRIFLLCLYHISIQCLLIKIVYDTSIWVLALIHQLLLPGDPVFVYVDIIRPLKFLQNIRLLYNIDRRYKREKQNVRIQLLNHLTRIVMVKQKQNVRIQLLNHLTRIVMVKQHLDIDLRKHKIISVISKALKFHNHLIV